MSTTMAMPEIGERLSGKIVFWSITSAMAGFLFGFDTVVISGAEQEIQSLWGLGPTAHGFAMASTLYGTVIGALGGGWPTDRFGRKPTLVFTGVLYLISAIWSAMSNDVLSFSLARFIGGLGIGISTVAAPLYNAEIAPPRHRGLLAGLFQFNIVFGIVVAYASNAMLNSVGENAWRWMLGVAAFPSGIYILCAMAIRESPRWLIGKKNDTEAGASVLREIHPGAPEAEIRNKVQGIATGAQEQTQNRSFWTWSLRMPILLAFLVAFFNQMSGINAILYFAPRIFEMAGLGAQAALLQSVGIGITLLVFTMLGVWLIDKLGRRTLLFIGSYGYILSLAAVAWGFFTQNVNIIPIGIFCFIAAHGVGQGTVIWVLIAEVFPDRHRAEGQALGSFTHWIFAALITTVFPKLIDVFSPGSIFLFFGGMMILQLVWVKTMVLETKGKPLELIQKQLRTVDP
jgi:MFS transporter, SP family, arabinose:H+ symporter